MFCTASGRGGGRRRGEGGSGTQQSHVRTPTPEEEEEGGEQLADHYFQHIAPSAAAAALHGVGVDSLLMIAF